jgi:hypothetical protein
LGRDFFTAYGLQENLNGEGNEERKVSTGGEGKAEICKLRAGPGRRRPGLLGTFGGQQRGGGRMANDEGIDDEDDDEDD